MLLFNYITLKKETRQKTTFTLEQVDKIKVFIYLFKNRRLIGFLTLSIDSLTHFSISKHAI